MKTLLGASRRQAAKRGNAPRKAYFVKDDTNSKETTPVERETKTAKCVVTLGFVEIGPPKLSPMFVEGRDGEILSGSLAINCVVSIEFTLEHSTHFLTQDTCFCPEANRTSSLMAFSVTCPHHEALLTSE